MNINPGIYTKPPIFTPKIHAFTYMFEDMRSPIFHNTLINIKLLMTLCHLYLVFTNGDTVRIGIKTLKIDGVCFICQQYVFGNSCATLSGLRSNELVSFSNSKENRQ